MTPDEARSVGLRVDPPWWNFIRQVVIFALGVGIVVYALVTPGHDIPFLIAGLILIGIVPVDEFIRRRNGKA